MINIIWENILIHYYEFSTVLLDVFDTFIIYIFEFVVIF